MTVLQIALFIGGCISGTVSMGSWLLTQTDAGITKEEAPVNLFVMCLTLLLFVFLLSTISLLQCRRRGLRSVLARAMFLVGTSGILVVLFFTVTSKGLVFKFGPLPALLLVTFGLSAWVFRPRAGRRNGLQSSAHE